MKVKRRRVRRSRGRKRAGSEQSSGDASSKNQDSGRSDSRNERRERREKRERGHRERRRDRGERHGSSRRGAKDSELDDFRERYPMDSRAFGCLSGASAEVQRTVLTRFKPRSEGDDDYSALVMTFVRAIQTRLENGTSGRAPPPREIRRQEDRSPASRGGQRSDSPLSTFRERYPMDERAFSALEQSAPAVRDVVIVDFKPRREGEDDYSALVMAFVRAVQSRVSVGRHRDWSGGRDRD